MREEFCEGYPEFHCENLIDMLRGFRGKGAPREAHPDHGIFGDKHVFAAGEHANGPVF